MLFPHKFSLLPLVIQNKDGPDAMVIVNVFSMRNVIVPVNDNNIAYALSEVKPVLGSLDKL